MVAGGWLFDWVVVETFTREGWLGQMAKAPVGAGGGNVPTVGVMPRKMDAC